MGSAEGDDAHATPIEIEPTATATRPPAIESLPQVPLDGLDGPARAGWVSAVNEVTSPCGEPISLARCVADGGSCRQCVPAARYLARLAREGLEPVELRELFRARYDRSTHVELEAGEAPVRGAPMARVTVIEFSDFECPHCAAAHPVLERLVHEQAGDVRVVFKNYPLGGHTHARRAARAAVAAQRQGKFWEMHDLLFANQAHLDAPDLERYAEAIGLDMERFRADLASDESEQRVAADRAQGVAAGVTGTPTIFVNGRQYLGPIEDIGTYVREELEE
jgi:glutaredoxin